MTPGPIFTVTPAKARCQQSPCSRRGQHPSAVPPSRRSTKPSGWLLAVCVLVSLANTGAVRAADAERDLATVAPADVGLRADGVDAIAAAMAKLVADGELAGAVTAVARHGKLAQFQAVGKQDIAKDTPMAKDSIFRIHSMTKPIASVALMTFFDEGRFALDDPIGKHMPKLNGLKVLAMGEDGTRQPVPASREPTIRELVSHTAGFTYGFFSRTPVDALYRQANILDNNSTLGEMIDKLAELPLWGQPGERWHYSVAADVQGYLVEVLAGKPFDQALRERVFEPLGMKDTAFFVPQSEASRLATLYSQRPGRPLVPMPGGEPFEPPKLHSGGGGLYSTAMDYMRFCQMLLNGGELDGARVLKPETVALMQTNQLPEAVEFINPAIGSPGNTFGIGFAIVAEPDGRTDHARAKGEVWWYGIGGTWFGVHPTEDLAIVGMVQNMGGAGARKARLQSKRLLYEAIEG